MTTIALAPPHVSTLASPSGISEDIARQMYQVWGGMRAICRERLAPGLREFVHRKIGPLTISRVHAASILLSREAREPLRTPESFHCMTIGTAGQQNVRIDARSISLESGGMYVNRNTQSLQVEAAHAIESYSLTIPTRLLSERLKNVDANLCMPFPTADARIVLLTHHVRGLFDASAALSAGEGEALSRQFCDMLAVLVHGVDAVQSREGGVANAMRSLVLDFLEQHYADETLTAESIAARCGISVSYLYKLMGASGATAIEYLRRVRLAAAHAMLADRQHKHLTVCDIAYRCGFSSQSDFCRAFKRRYGQPASDLRRR